MTTTSLHSTLITCALLTSAGAASAAPHDLFLRLDGVKGESANAKHKDEIDVESYEFGVSQAGGLAFGGGGGAGKAAFHDLKITKPLDLASGKLFLAAATGEHFKSVVLSVDGPNGTVLSVNLSDVLVTSYVASGKVGPKPTENVVFSYAKIQLSYHPQSPDGKPGAPVTVGFDAKAARRL